MFLPNTYSFVLTRGKIVDPTFTPETRRGVFLPNTDSFLLRRRTIVWPSFTPGTENVAAVLPQSTNSEQPKIKDQGKRNFLKVASVAGAAAIASQILSPKKASAFIMGSSPTTGVVGVKDDANVRINPATEETAATLATEATVSTLATEATAATLLKTTDLDFDADGALEVASFSDSGGLTKKGLVDADRHVQVDVVNLALPPSASTETTLQAISFGGFKFALRLATVGDVDYIGEAAIGTDTDEALWRIKKVDSTSGIIIQWAGTGIFDQVWDDRTTLTYS